MHINPFEPNQPLKLQNLTLNQHYPYTNKTKISLADGLRTHCGNLQHSHKLPSELNGKGRICQCLTGEAFCCWFLMTTTSATAVPVKALQRCRLSD